MTPEGRTKKVLKVFLTNQGIYHFWPVQNGYGAATVDCLACCDGKFLAIETKRAGVKTPTGRQKLTLAAIKEAGGSAYVVSLDARGSLIWFAQ
jgi:hypothetical protein